MCDKWLGNKNGRTGGRRSNYSRRSRSYTVQSARQEPYGVQRCVERVSNGKIRRDKGTNIRSCSQFVPVFSLPVRGDFCKGNWLIILLGSGHGEMYTRIKFLRVWFYSVVVITGDSDSLRVN